MNYFQNFRKKKAKLIFPPLLKINKQSIFIEQAIKPDRSHVQYH